MNRMYNPLRTVYFGFFTNSWGVDGSDVSRPRNAGRRLTQPSVGWAGGSDSSRGLDAGGGVVQSGESRIEQIRALPCSSAV